MPANTDSFTASIAAAVRAEFGRQGKQRSELATILGIHRVTAYSRMNGQTPFKSDELFKVAKFLGTDVYGLIASAELGNRLSEGSVPASEVEHPLPPQDPWAQPARSRARRAS